MALPVDEKKKIIKRFKTHDEDTGSPEVQVALLTKRVEKLTQHLKGHPHDKHSRKGLIGLIGQRRRLLHYLMQTDESRYKNLVNSLGLSK
jgi:small subunit ribosomal protein S15